MVKEQVGDSVSVQGEIFSPFSQLLELLNYEYALMGLLDDPGKSHAMLERLTLGAIDLGKRQVQAGVDAVLISSAFAGAGFVSRADYETFVLPYETRLIEALHAAYPGLKVYTHTCGAIGDRLDLMLRSGLEGSTRLTRHRWELWNSSRPAHLRGKAFIKGNLDPVNTLLHGNEETVREAVEQRLEIAKPGVAISSARPVRLPPR